MYVMRGQPFLQLAANRVAAGAEVRQAGKRIAREVEAIEVVEHRHVNGRRDGPLLLVAAHMDVRMIACADRSGDESARDSRDTRRSPACRA